MSQHWQSWRLACAKFGLDMTVEQFLRWAAVVQIAQFAWEFRGADAADSHYFCLQLCWEARRRDRQNTLQRASEQ